MRQDTETQKALHLSGEITAHYRIVNRLGRGGMGDVYLAEQIGVKRLVALKVLRRSYSEDGDIIRRFENEAIATGKLDHPNIVRIYDCRTTSDGQIYVAMEYVGGENLRKMIHEQAPLPPRNVAVIIRQIAAGLDAAHREGIVHRDIKPDNIMVAQEGSRTCAKIVDFGIARLIATTIDHTATGSILGSASYMSPEQAEGLTGNLIDARSDIYSLGMVVYEMLTGRVAFKANSFTELVHKQRYDSPPLPTFYQPKLSEEVEAVVLRALEKDRSLRQQSVLEFAAELDDACNVNDELNKDDQAFPARIAESRAAFEGEQPQPPRFTAPSNQIPATATSMTNTLNQRTAYSSRRFFLTILAAIVAGTILVFLTYYINRWLKLEKEREKPSIVETSGRAPAGVLKFKVLREKETAELATLSPDNTFRSGENIHFKVQLTTSGLLYLLHENSDGSMKWINAGSNNQPQLGSAGVWLDVPDENWIGTKDVGLERFLLIYVPVGVSWSLEGFIHPGNIEIGESDFPEFSRTAALRVLNDLQKNGVLMSSSTVKSDREIVHNLVMLGHADRVAFYEFELKSKP